MSTSLNLSDRSVILYTLEGEKIADTFVMDFDKKLVRIDVYGLYDELSKDAAINALVILENGVMEYRAIVKELHDFSTTLALLKGEKMERRGATRYDINDKSTIENMYMSNRVFKMPTPIEIYIVNLSVSGARFNSPPRFNLNAKFEFFMQFPQNTIKVPAKIIRMKPIDKDTTEYVCVFNQD